MTVTGTGKPSVSGLAAALAELADAIARAQRGERVSIDSLGIAIVPAEDVATRSSADDEVEEGMIELDR